MTIKYLDSFLFPGMNTQQEIHQTFAGYLSSQFGCWPREHYNNLHPRTERRFVRHKDGKEERPGEG